MNYQSYSRRFSKNKKHRRHWRQRWKFMELVSDTLYSIINHVSTSTGHDIDETNLDLGLVSSRSSTRWQYRGTDKAQAQLLVMDKIPWWHLAGSTRICNRHPEVPSRQDWSTCKVVHGNNWLYIEEEHQTASWECSRTFNTEGLRTWRSEKDYFTPYAKGRSSKMSRSTCTNYIILGLELA